METNCTCEAREKGRSLFKLLTDYTVIDIETTGLAPARDEIIEIGAVRVRGGEITDTFSALIKPERPISYFITDLTGISNAMVADAPSVGEVLPRFLDFVGSDVIVGHNVCFDINFLHDKAMRYSERGFTNDYVDTMRLSRRLFPEERHHKLSDLEQRFGLHNDSAHRALSDVLLANDCYNYMRRCILDRGIDLT